MPAVSNKLAYHLTDRSPDITSANGAAYNTGANKSTNYTSSNKSPNYLLSNCTPNDRDTHHCTCVCGNSAGWLLPNGRRWAGCVRLDYY